MKKTILSLLTLLLVTPPLFGGGREGAASLPQDPAVRTGKLKNGMMADFYIAQRVGSILEEPRQRGLAHFLEHMAFNGTKHFPGVSPQSGGRKGALESCRGARASA